MSVPEIIFRFKQFLQKKYELKFRQGSFQVFNSWKFSDKIIDIDCSDLSDLPEKINIFHNSFHYSSSISWNLDFLSGKKFPSGFSKDIDIRSDKYGSAKVVWEINRLQFQPWICINYKKSNNKKYLELFIRQITEWIEQNPYLKGVNWYSNIEINIRLINWFFCWEILDVNELIKKDYDFKAFVLKKWLPLIYLHCNYSYANPSKYSSANNHLISEYAGLFIASSLWKFKESKKWNKYAKRGLEREILAQHSKNGINKEQAAEYIQFITDFFLISYIVAEKSNNVFSEKYRIVLEKICNYISNFLDMNGNFPKYGDEDDGKVIYIDSYPSFNNFKSILLTGSHIFNKDFDTSNYYCDNKNLILLPEFNKEYISNKLDKEVKKGSCFYPEEGHFILRKSNKQFKELYIYFDAAPLGFLSIAAHGHADALSFILNVNGYPFFIDSGTYTYHTHPEWRKYFISTLAHNTCRINKLDQATNKGPTLWLNHYKTNIIKSESSDKIDEVIATHSGYKKLNVWHKRKFLFLKEKNEIVIEDEILNNRNCELEIEIPFHLHPNIQITPLSNVNFRLTNSDNELEMITDEKLKCKIVRGKIEPVIGWYSSSFYVKEPTNVIYNHTKIKNSAIFITKIRILK